KLERLLENERELYVDGTPMVRDIWADGSDGSSPDGKKETGEFHTVAVLGERRGGTHFFALDVTNPVAPTPETSGFFRWMWPQPNTVADRLAGQSYDDFLPTPPPIGPVRLKNTVISGLPTYATPVNPPAVGRPSVPFEERWVVGLNGGYDAAKQRGHTVSLVDVWYGGQGVVGQNSNPLQAIWTFDPRAQVPLLGNMQSYSFAAPVGMVGFGWKETNVTLDQNGFFFDTATIGDMGGQLWTLRFNDPDPAYWAGARSLLNDDTGSPSNYCARQPFFGLTSNVIASQGGHLRTMLGSGDRSNLTDLGGGECSYDNLLACQRRGCAVDVTYTMANACGSTSTFTRSYGAGSAASCAMTVDNEVTGVPALGANCCTTGGSNDLNATLTITLTGCNGAPGIISWSNAATCHAVASATTMCNSPTTQATYVCDPVSKTPINIPTIWPTYNSNVAGMPDNAFYSVKTFDEANVNRKIFNEPLIARNYDLNVLRPSNLVTVNPITTLGAGTIANAGWVAHYNHAGPTHNSTYNGFFNGSDINERTSAGSTVVGGCAFWSTYLPSSTTSVCAAATTGLNTQYHLDMISGGKCLKLDPALALSSYQQASQTSPPVPPQLTEFVAPDGTITLALVGVPRQAGAAASVTKVAASTELIKDSFVLDVPRPEHSCRHAPGPDLPSQRVNAQANCY
ncbi:MAG TPA: hypothetical protein VFA20_00895, partial [Myxococcaceae bacterium]|nr:hypothetical protein [Myxococcaceae bacterium]